MTAGRASERSSALGLAHFLRREASVSRLNRPGFAGGSLFARGDRPYPGRVLQDLLVPYDAAWPKRYAVLRAAILGEIGSDVLRVDHVGSTSVPGLASKDVIDIQVTVARLSDADEWPDVIGTFVRRDNFKDHVPPGGTAGPDWEKRYWSSREPRSHMHVRVADAANHRYALLFRDYLRANREPVVAYERLKFGLAQVCENTAEYADLKDPGCDLILQAAERWAKSVGWNAQTSTE